LEIQKVGGHAAVLQSKEALDEAIRSLVSRYGVRRALCNRNRVMEELAVSQLLRQAGVDVTDVATLTSLSESALRDLIFGQELGVAAPDWAVAETGSLVYVAGPTQLRSSSLLPPVHLAIVDRACIISDLLQIPMALQQPAMEQSLPQNVVLVTGPSKTGDIELRLTTGVHGPGELHVLVWSP
jgi:L-lactate utilization protein LutC